MSLGYKILGIAFACVAIFFMGRCSVGKQEITTIERVDTVVVEKPMPYKVEVVRKVSVPVYVPTPADTVVVARLDSVCTVTSILACHRFRKYCRPRSASPRICVFSSSSVRNFISGLAKWRSSTRRFFP